MPTAREGAFTGVIGKKIYVVGGASSSSVLNINEIYNTVTNAWTTGAAMPTPRWVGGSAVVNDILYTMGGQSSTSLTSNVVEAYNPATDTWTTKASMPVTSNSFYAVVDKGLIFAIGGFNAGSGRLATVQVYNPGTDQWTQGPPLNVGKSLAAAALLGREIVAAGGQINSGDATTDNEGYRLNVSWKSLAPVPTAREGGCFEGAEWGTLYFAGGSAASNAYPLTVLEAYTLKTNSWTTGLASMPNAVVNSGSASLEGRLYCFGGSDSATIFQGNIFDYVQIYQP